MLSGIFVLRLTQEIGACVPEDGSSSTSSMARLAATTAPCRTTIPSKFSTDGRGGLPRFGFSTTIAARLEPLLRDAGFTNIHCKVHKVPIGVWAKDKTLRLIGLYQKTAVLEFISTFAGRPFEALGLNPVEVQVILARARKSLEDPQVHRYFNYYFWYAQKPGEQPI